MFLKKLVIGLLSGFSLTSLAYAGTGETPVSQGLSYITTALTGATGITIATLSIMVVGLLCLSHVLKWSVMVYTIMGISIVFGASSIATSITTLLK